MKKTTISCSKETIDFLHKVIKKKIQYSMKDGTFGIDELVVNKKGVTYDNAIHWLCEFFILFDEEFEKDSKKGKIISDKFIKWFKSKKMNSIA